MATRSVENVFKKSAVGKTSIVNRVVSGTFQAYVKNTLSIAAYAAANVYYQDTEYRLGLWDTVGDEKFRAVASITYRDAAAALLVYDLTDEETFDDVHYWMNELRRKAPEDILVFVIGNKLDLESQRAVSRSSAVQYAQENDAVHLEASAKTGEGISEILQEICAALAKTSKERNYSYHSLRQEHTIRLSPSVNSQHGQRENTARGCRCRKN
ncbi:ras-related protein Rab-5A-like isoform X2 [Diadema antillarum]|uniref:ras-related protein Rab-5A-like isoform X2 n=1 Tax=Diadema antillarum TaxID=105358 RepID=UPI003A85DDA7